MRIVLIIAGALFGIALAQGPSEIHGALVGALAGLGIATYFATRSRVSALEREVAELRRRREDIDRRPPRENKEAGVASVSEGDTPASTAVGVAGAARGAQETPTSNVEATLLNSTASSAPREALSQAAAFDAGAPRPSAEAGSSASSSQWRRPPAPEPPPEELAVIKAIREYFTGGNTLVRVGVVILFIGVAFLLRYVAEHTHVPIELRLSGVAAAGVVLLAIGWRLRKKRPGYALTVQGGAIGILYLTVFASLRLFHVLPAGPAFIVLVLLSAASAALAILQNSMALSLFSIGCGFLAPVLASSGQGNHVILFSYYAVLNLGIFAIAWFKAWRPLNVAGFLFTFVIGSVWGVLKYRAELFATTEPFLVGFFLLYIAIAILFSLRQQPVLRGYVDGTIVFGMPVVAFGLQSAMVRNWPFVTAYSAAAVSAIYLVLAWLLHRGRRETQRQLVEAFLALGIAFLTLTIPLALDGRWSAATWALEGAALVWVGCRQDRRLPRAFGALLQIAGGVIFLFDYAAPYSSVPVLNSACLGGVMIAFASVFAARMFEKARDDLRAYEQPFVPVLFFWGLLWWLFSGVMEIVRHVPDLYRPASVLVFFGATALLSSEVHRRLELAVARLPPLALLPVMVLFALVEATELAHPLKNGGWLAWPAAFTAFYFLCRRHESGESTWPSRPLHAGAALLLIGLVAWEFSWQVDHAVKGGGSWPAIAWVLIPAIALHVLPKLVKRGTWPVVAHEETYVAIVGAVLALFMVLWSFGTNITMRGDPYPLPYVPLLNPLDLAEALALLILTRYGLHLHQRRYPILSFLKSSQLVWLLGALVFVWLNAILLRTIHHWTGVPYVLDILFRSTLVQTALTIFWTVIALATMLFATRRAVRLVWIAGAVLMAVVIAKLFLIDLSRIGTVERIVSFVGVGVLMLVVGYFSPLPPARREAV